MKAKQHPILTALERAFEMEALLKSAHDCAADGDVWDLVSMRQAGQALQEFRDAVDAAKSKSDIWTIIDGEWRVSGASTTWIDLRKPVDCSD